MHDLKAQFKTLAARFGKSGTLSSFEERVLRDWEHVLVATLILLSLGVGAGGYAYWLAVHIESGAFVSGEQTGGRALVDPVALRNVVKTYEERSAEFTTLREAAMSAPQPSALVPEVVPTGDADDTGEGSAAVVEASSTESVPTATTPTPSM